MNYLKERKIPFFYLYDEKGSYLYNEITKLSEYYPYRKEEELLSLYVSEIVQIDDDQFTEGITLVELGAGYSTKTEVILKSLLSKYKKVTYVPIDVSESACKISEQKYRNIQGLEILPYVGTYDAYLDTNNIYNNRTMYLWLGSSIGNLNESDQISILSRIQGVMTYRDFLLMGMDTVYKDKSIFEKAYNDEKGVTAEFILNILTHLKKKYHLEFKEENFVYKPIWNEDFNRVEMYLECIKDTTVIDTNNREENEIKQGEKIFVEYSHKFSVANVEKLAESSNLVLNRVWMTKDRYFMMAKLIKSVKPLWDFTAHIFDNIIKEKNLLQQPISLRNPLIFYFGHIYTFYDIKIFSLEKENKFFELFERGRDPLVDDPDTCHVHSDHMVEYPEYEEIKSNNNLIKKKVLELISQKGYTYNIMVAIEHEMMHQETLLYMLRQGDFILPISLREKLYTPPKKSIVSIPKRKLIQGTNETFSWDNESPEHMIDVENFKVDNLPVTWEEMRPFIEENDHLLNKIININKNFEIRISSSQWIDYNKGRSLPAWVNLDIAQLYVEWINSKGNKCRLMKEEEFDSLVSTLKSTTKGNTNFKNFHATPVGLYDDQSEDGVYELMGNGWELTSSLFRAFNGFKKMEIYPEYSSDFFTDLHFVVKGAGPFTNLCRKSFRNWYQHNYQYHTSKFRLVHDEN